MSCLDPKIKAEFMLNHVRGLRHRLDTDDTLRPKRRQELEEELVMMREEIKFFYFEINNILN
jgi:hypothetical protein